MIKRKLFSLQYKFLIISLCITIIPLLIVGGLSYTNSTAIIEKKISQSNHHTVQQIADNINLIFDDMENSAVYLWQDQDFMDYLRLPPSEIQANQNYILKAQNSVNNFVLFKTAIYSLYVQGFNGLTFDSVSADNTISPELEQQLYGLSGESMLIFDTVTNYDGTQTRVISLVRLLKDMNDLSSDLAFIKINVAEEEISDIYRSKLLGTKGDYFIIDEGKHIISSMDKGILGNTLDAKYDDARLSEASNGYFMTGIDDHSFLVTYFDLDRPGWKLVNLVPMDELSEDIDVMKRITSYAILASLVLCLLVILLFSFRILGPMRQIRRLMKHIENENFNVRFPVKGNDEIALLGKGFNEMSAKLDELINEVYAAQIRRKEAELAALQSQINPHFLYNTLDTIYWMCRVEKANESAGLVHALSKLFRLSLNKGNEFTTVRDELAHLRFYITIQEKRFEDLIDFHIEASEEVLSCRVVKLVLQPLVENAIQHGIEKKGTKGKIHVHIYREDDTLLYTVADDGVGADREELYALLKKVGEANRGFGIKNVNDRIKLYFGNKYGIAFETAPGRGMTVIVRQPFSIGG